MEKTTTRKFDKLPSMSGTPFSGFQDIKIKSRQVVEDEIYNFIEYCRGEAKGISGRFILGEWGEGKTDTYERLIKPEIEDSGDYLFFVSASRLSNSYENESVMNFAKFELLEDAKMLIHLFNSIKSGLDPEDDLIPDYKNFNNPKSFLESVLDNLLEGKKDKKIFIFIDEFEELLSNTRVLRKIISGLKEGINGEYAPLKENGKYEGCLHFFVACTPEAYYKIQVHDDTKGIMGGFDRRINKIKLPEIRKEEGINYLYSLLNYSYDYNLPNPMPISDISLFNTILRICHGNLGIITSIFTDLFNSLRKEDEIEILNHRNLINFLKNKEINVFGANTPCIDNENYDKITKNLKEQSTDSLGDLCLEVFNLLLGEYKPFKLDEISSRTSSSRSDILTALEIINKTIYEQEKIEKSVIKLSPVKKEINFEGLESELKEEYNYIKSTDNKKNFVIPFTDYEEPLSTFKDRITFYEFEKEKNSLSPSMYLPVGYDINPFFNDEIKGSEDRVEDVLSSFREDEKYYMASDSLLNHIYPTPVPPELIYFTDKLEKLKLWRCINHNLRDLYEKNFLDAFLEALKKSNILEVNEKTILDGFPIISLRDDETNTTINTLVYVVNGDIKPKILNELNNLLYENLDVHLALLLYNGDMIEKSTKILSENTLSELDRLLPLQMHASLAKKILFGFLANNTKKYNKFVENELYGGICKKLVDEDINFSNTIKSWIDVQKNTGLIIDEIVIKSTNNIKVFADGLKLYLNYEGSFTPQEIYQKNFEEILKYKKFGGKGFIAADYEDSPKTFESVTRDLIENGFLIEDSNGKLSVKISPVEKKIIEILKRNKKISISNLVKCLVNRDRKEKTFESVFINILEYKGIISKSNNNLEFSDVNTALNNLKIDFKNYKKELETNRISEDAHYYERKKYGGKLIMLNEFDHFLNYRYEIAVNEKDPKNALLKINICRKLITQYRNYFEKAIIHSSEEEEKLINNLKCQKKEFDDVFEDVLHESRKWLRIKVDENNIFEYKIVKNEFDTIITINNKNYSKNDLENEISQLETNYKDKYGKEGLEEKLFNIFNYSKDYTNSPYYNLKFYLMEIQSTKLENKMSKIKTEFLRILNKFEEIENRNNEIKSELKDLEKKSKNAKIAKHMFKKLKAPSFVAGDLKEIGHDIYVIDLVEKAEKRITDIRKRIKLITEYTTFIEELSKDEKIIVAKINGYKSDCQKIKEIFNIDEYKNDVQNFEDKLEEFEINYENMDIDKFIEKNRKQSGKELRFKVDKIGKIKTKIELEWENFNLDIENSISNHEKIICLLMKKENLSENNELEEIKKEFEEVKKYLSKPLLHSKKSAKEINQITEDLSLKAKKIIEKYLSDDEQYVFMTLESINTKWLDFDKIKQIILERNNMDEDILEKTIENLVKKGYMQKGFSLTI